MNTTEKRNRPRLQIIRGMPGSGKTTLAIKEYPDLLRLETDMYFTRNGEYIFTKKLNEEAVEWFYDAVEKAAECGIDFVVTGVFAAHTERLSRVLAITMLQGYDVYIKTLTDDFGNTHGVPKEHLDAMRANFTSEDRLKEVYKDFSVKGSSIHFGLMPKTKPVH